MKQCFCDCCGKQVYEQNLMSRQLKGYDVDLCQKCDEIFLQKLEDSRIKTEVEFMETMKYQPLAFKYHCE